MLISENLRVGKGGAIRVRRIASVESLIDDKHKGRYTESLGKYSSRFGFTIETNRCNKRKWKAFIL